MAGRFVRFDLVSSQFFDPDQLVTLLALHRSVAPVVAGSVVDLISRAS
jgi:hypothetical protein